MRKMYPEPFKHSDGRSKSYYFTWVDPDGTRSTHSTRELTKEKARQRIREFVDAQTEHAKNPTGSLTFAEYAAPYFLPASCPHMKRMKGKIGIGHANASRRLLVKHVFNGDPTFSKLKLVDIRRRDLLDLQARLQEKKVGHNTIDKVFAAIKVVFSEAVFRQDLDFDPGSGIGRIQSDAEVKKRGALLPSEIQAILEKKPGLGLHRKGAGPGRPKLEGKREARTILEFAVLSWLIGTGCRVGEIRALRWRAINLETRRCVIDEAVKEGGGIALPKWNKTREIALPDIVWEPLMAWKAVSFFTSPEDHVFTEDPEGAAIGGTWINHFVARVITKAQDGEILPKDDDRWLTAHSFRHTLNTALLAAEVSPLLVQSFLGWSSQESKILSRVQAQYSHLELLRLETVAEKIDELFGASTAVVDKTEEAG